MQLGQMDALFSSSRRTDMDDAVFANPARVRRTNATSFANGGVVVLRYALVVALQVTRLTGEEP
jgi:hypothetical protein